MRFSLVGVLVCFVLISCGQEERSIEEVNLVQEGDLLKYYFQGKPFSGLVIDQTKPSGRIIYTVKAGKLDGPTKHFDQAQSILWLRCFHTHRDCS